MTWQREGHNVASEALTVGLAARKSSSADPVVEMFQEPSSRPEQAPTQFRKNREGWNCRSQKNTPHRSWVKVQGSVNPRFAASLPFPVPKLEYIRGSSSLSNIKHFENREKFPRIVKPSLLLEFKSLDLWRQDCYPVPGRALAASKGEHNSSQHQHWIALTPL